MKGGLVYAAGVAAVLTLLTCAPTLHANPAYDTKILQVTGNRHASHHLLGTAAELRFKTFMVEYGKEYATRGEYLYRLGIFAGNLIRAAEHQAMDPTAVHGVTQFSDLSEEEFEGMYMGVKGGGGAARTLGIEAAEMEVGDLPESFDWREKGAVTDVKMQSLGKRVNDFRGELKAEYYEPYKHDRNYLLNNRPARVPNDQWLDLLTYWNNEKTKRRANTNRNNQKNLKMPHCAGRKSFARYRAEQTVNGVEPSRAKVFIDTHKDRKTKDKKKIDEESAEAVELMKKKMDELPNGIEQNDGQIAWKGDIFDQVIKKPERYGKVRGVGLGVCPSILWGQCSSNRSTIDMLNDDTSNEEIEKLIEHRVKVIQEKHQQEIRVIQQKNDMQLKAVLDRQSRLEGNMSQLIALLTERAEDESDDDPLTQGWGS